MEKVTITSTRMTEPGSVHKDPFHQVLDEMYSLHARKSHDYGTDSDPLANFRGSSQWGVAPWVGALIRAQDKMYRLQRAADGVHLRNESVEDSLIDGAMYFVHALCLYREQTALASEASYR